MNLHLVQRERDQVLALSLALLNEMGAVGKIAQHQNAPSVWFKREELTPQRKSVKVRIL